MGSKMEEEIFGIMGLEMGIMRTRTMGKISKKFMGIKLKILLTTM